MICAAGADDDEGDEGDDGEGHRGKDAGEAPKFAHDCGGGADRWVQGWMWLVSC